MFFGVSVQAQDVQQPTPEATSQIAKSDPAPAPNDAPASPAANPEQSQPMPEAVAIPAYIIKMVEVGQKYDKYNPQDWTVADFPSTGNTLLSDRDGIREGLAQKKIGFGYLYQTIFYDNLINPPMFGAQGKAADGKYHDPVGKDYMWWYWGQRPSYVERSLGTLTYNPNPNTQFVFQGWDSVTNFGQGEQCNSPRVAALNLNQYLFNRKMQLSAGYMAQGWHTVGFFVAGNLASSLLGNAAILQALIGQAPPYHVTPGIDVRYNWTSHIYTVDAVASSADPIHSAAPSSMGDMRFAPHGAKAIITQELGYKRDFAPGVRKLWMRVDGLYNFTKYPDYRSSGLLFAPGSPIPTGFGTTKKTDNNWGFSGAFDYQFKQLDKILFPRGLFVGGTMQYAPPQQNMYSQYYELRTYAIGLWKKRPMDMLTLQANHLGFSSIWVKNYVVPGQQLQAAMTNTYINPSWDSGQQGYSATYVARVANGLFFNQTWMYTTHPTPAPKTPNSFVYNGALTFFF